MDILYSRYSRKKNKKTTVVGDISSLFQRHCQTNKVQSWQDVVSQSSEVQ